MKNKKEKIKNQFNGFTNGVRMIMLTQRGKEGGKVTNPDKVSKRKIVVGSEEFEKVLTEFLAIKEKSKQGLRIYSCVNKRDLDKGIREFKRTQLEADYYDELSKYRFYLDIKNRFMSALMKPSSRAETKFLIDVDEGINKLEVERKLRINGIKILLLYPTKNGWHYVTEPFNPNLWDKNLGEIKKDALLLLDF